MLATKSVRPPSPTIRFSRGLKASKNRPIAAAIQGDGTQHYVVLVALIEGLVQPTANLTPTSNADKVVPLDRTGRLSGFAGRCRYFND